MADVTQILNAAHVGQTKALDQLLPLVYEELRLLAQRQLAQEQPGQTLQPTALVHEAYLRLVPNSGLGPQEPEREFENRRYFFAAAAEAMRRILVEKARRKLAVRHGGNKERQIQDLDQLPEAVKTGYKDAAHMVKDIDLDSLRDRDDFKKLLAELTKQTVSSKSK